MLTFSIVNAFSGEAGPVEIVQKFYQASAEGDVQTMKTIRNRSLLREKEDADRAESGLCRFPKRSLFRHDDRDRIG